jgi:hypothetical protein
MMNGNGGTLNVENFANYGRANLNDPIGGHGARLLAYREPGLKFKPRDIKFIMGIQPMWLISFFRKS